MTRETMRTLEWRVRSRALCTPHGRPQAQGSIGALLGTPACSSGPFYCSIPLMHDVLILGQTCHTAETTEARGRILLLWSGSWSLFGLVERRIFLESSVTLQLSHRLNDASLYDRQVARATSCETNSLYCYWSNVSVISSRASTVHTASDVPHMLLRIWTAENHGQLMCYLNTYI